MEIDRSRARGYIGGYAKRRSSIPIPLTLLSPLVFNVHMLSGMAQYDPQIDLAPVSLVTKVPSVITVHSTAASKSVRELVAAAKASPNKITYGSSGSSGVNHLITKLFRSAAGIELTHVPYKGARPAMIALLPKEIDSSVASPVAIMAQVRAGQVRALGGVGRGAFARNARCANHCRSGDAWL